METAAARRNQPSSSTPSKGWGAPSPVVAGPGECRAFWSVWVVVACLSFPTLVFVSGAYRPPLAAFSSFYGGSTSQQQLLMDGPPMPLSPANNFSIPYLRNINMAPSSSPSTASNPSAAELLYATAPSSSPTTASNLSAAELLYATAPSPSPTTYGGKLPHAVPLQKAAAATSPSLPPSATSSSEAKLHNIINVSVPAALTSHPDAHDDKLLGGLLPASFDGASCQSRYQSFAYRRASPHKPSPYLLRRLRAYEALHKRCGPLTRSYKSSLRLLKSGRNGGASAAGARCKYVVWKPLNGLGNRMLSMASAFLYALLSGRVLLVERSTDMAGIFCEPFPGSTWLLPRDSPLRNLPVSENYPLSFGNLLKANKISTANPPGFVYAHLSNGYDVFDMRFYCEDSQLLLEKIPWLVLRSNQYFVPALFINPTFERELNQMFPEKDAVFHILGRYLFHPSDQVWGLITNYYKDHLASARHRLGIQIRVFDKNKPFDLILRQILNCTVSEKLLPDVGHLKKHVTPSVGGPSKAVLLTSLHGVFYDKMKAMYSGHVWAGGEVVSIHQPSHEEEQQTGRAVHDKKALAEMYLLSLTDALVTSAWSTFGYVAQALGGMTPWVLVRPGHGRVPEPSCIKEMSPEPCFHYPPSYDCKTGGHADMAKLIPFTKPCRDRNSGVKLVDHVRQ